MIITADDMRDVRPIAENIIDANRIDPYIDEAEKLLVLRTLHAGIYEQLLTIKKDTVFPVIFIDTNGKEFIFTNKMYDTLYNGGFYGGIPIDSNLYGNEVNSSSVVQIKSNTNDNISVPSGKYNSVCCDSRRYNNGLIKAVSYLAYSRMLFNQELNVTAFGVVRKKTQYSDAIEEKELVRSAKEAEKIGLEYLRQSVEYLEYIKLICNSVRTIGVRKFIKIGK